MIVDLTARAYDGIAAIAEAHAAGRPVLAVGQHDDVALRRQALAAGADRVLRIVACSRTAHRQLACVAVGESQRGVARMIARPVLRSRPSATANAWQPPRRCAEEAGLAAILVGVGADMRYLTGYPAMPLERLTMLVIPAGGSPSLVAPLLEATPARSCPPAAAGRPPGRDLAGDGRSARARGRPWSARSRPEPARARP